MPPCWRVWDHGACYCFLFLLGECVSFLGQHKIICLHCGFLLNFTVSHFRNVFAQLWYLPLWVLHCIVHYAANQTVEKLHTFHNKMRSETWSEMSTKFVRCLMNVLPKEERKSIFYPLHFCPAFHTDTLTTNLNIFPFQLCLYQKCFSKSPVEVSCLGFRLSSCCHHLHPFPFRFHKLEKWRKPFYDVLQVYENASVLLPAFYNTRNTDVSIRVKYVLDDFESQQAVYYFHPQYLINVSRYWLGQGVRAKRISTGLILVTAALELCEEVHLFGFWAFPMNPSGIFITHHYYDNVKPRPGFHAMPSEIFNFLHMHSKGILRVHTGTCSCCWQGQFFLWCNSRTGTRCL